MENPDQKKYSPEAILALAIAIGRDEDAFNWLMENDNKELAALTDVLLYEKNEALDWLKNNHFNLITSFVGALEEDKDAIDYLLLNHGKQWAAVADLVNGNDGAQEWLAQYFPHFIKLADSLIDNTLPVNRKGNIPRMGGFTGGRW
jgi:hypothetical protein